MLQRNPHPWPVTLPELREPDGTVHPTRDVEGGDEIDWPIRIAGFENLEPDPEPTPAETPAPASEAEQPAPAADTQTDAAPAAAVKTTTAAKTTAKQREGASA